MKKRMRKREREWVNNIGRRRCCKARANEAVRRLCGEPPKIIVIVRNRTGKFLTNEVEAR